MVTDWTASAGMPVIDRQLFTGRDEPTETDWISVSAPDTSNRAVAAVLERHGWERKGAAAIGLKLSPDNTAVSSARLVLLGSWDKKIQMQAKKLFQRAAEDVLLEIEFSDMGIFRCKDGDMWSQYVPQAGFKCNYTRGGKVLDEDEKTEQGIQELAARAVAHLSKDCGLKWGIWLNVTVLVFPLSDEAMKALSEDTANPAWRGIKITEGQIPILPAMGRDKKLFGGKDWGCPATPVVAPGVPWEAAPGPVKGKK